MKRLLDFYKNPYQNGIFYSMSKIPDFVEIFQKLGINTENDMHAIDVDYLYNHSGLKTVSFMIEEILKGFILDDDNSFVEVKSGKRVTWDYIINEIDFLLVNTVIRIKYLKKWSDLADTVYVQFDMLKPYSMSVSEESKEELSSEGKDSSDTKDVTETTDTTSSSSSGQSSSKEKGFRSGFNSSSPVPVENSESETESESSATENSTQHVENTGTRSSKSEYSRGTTIGKTIIRSGNIGNRSSQELIEEQRKMLLYQIFDTIYNDLDSVLTRSKYIL